MFFVMDDFINPFANIMQNARSCSSYVCLSLRFGLCCLVGGVIGACDDMPAVNSLKQLDTNVLSPAQVLTYGRQSAIYQHLSRYWRLESINGSPVAYQFYLDLTQLSSGVATATAPAPCSPIEMVVDVSNIDKNQVSVTDIYRVLDSCSDKFEDNLMAILADTKTITKAPHHPDKLLLTSRQDTLIFVPADTP